MDASERLLKFLQNVFYTDRGNPVKRIVLVRLMGDIDRPILDWPIKEVRSYDQPRIIELSNEILDHAQGDCDSNPDRQSNYSVLAYLGENKSTDLRSSTIRMRPQLRGDEANAFEPAKGEKEVIPQLSNLVQKLANLLIQSESNRQQYDMNMHARLIARNERLEADRDESIQALEAILNERAEREIKAKKAEAMILFQKELTGKLKVMLPTLANRALGKTVFPEITNPGIEAIKSLIEDLDPEQVSEFQKVLKPHQWAALESLMKAMVRLDEKGGNGHG